MRRLTFVVIALLCVSIAPGAPASAETGSRVIVSNTLNDTLQIFDANTFVETQLPVPSKGMAPVRLALATIGSKALLFSANHGIAGSVGVFDVSGETIVELPASPFATGGLGTVGISVGDTGSGPYVVATNTWQALAGCSVPKGSLTTFDAGALATAGVLVNGGTRDLLGAQPFATEADGAIAYATSNCSNTVEVYEVAAASPLGVSAAPVASAATGSGPDGVAVDGNGNVYVANIGSSTVSVYKAKLAGGVATTVPVGKGPVEIVAATLTSGRPVLITGNGGNDSISVLDRDVVTSCVVSAAPSCNAELARISTWVAGGAPESVSFDPATDRVFVVNKTFPPSLSVIQLIDEGISVTGSPIATIPLGALGHASDIPSFIAFDVVVQPR